MNDGKLNYALVGGFVVAAIAALIVVLSLVSGRGGAADTYHAVFTNVAGLRFGTPVLYEGYQVGQVEAIEPEPGPAGMRFRVDMSVVEGWKIPADSIAQIISPRLLSAVSVNITAGGSAEVLEPGAVIASRGSVNMFMALSDLALRFSRLTDESIRPVLSSLDTTLRRVNDVLGGEGRGLAGELEALARLLNDRAPAIIGDVETLLARSNAAVANVNALVGGESGERARAAIGNLERSSEDLARVAQTVDGMTHTLNALVEENRGAVTVSLGNVRYVTDSLARDIDSINQNLDGTARNLYEFSRQVRQNPGLLLSGTSPPEAALRE